MPGSPDFSNVRKGFAVFVNGCFWHHHTGCRRATVPGRNRMFWQEKFSENRRRDAARIRSLRAMGLKVVVWECRTVYPDDLMNRLCRALGRSQMGVPGGVEVREPLDQIRIVKHVAGNRGGGIGAD